MGFEGSSPTVWGARSANVRTQCSPRKQLLSSEQLPLLERRSFPNKRSWKGGWEWGGKKWAEEREVSRKSQRPLTSLLQPPSHSPTAGSPWVIEMMTPSSLGRLPRILYQTTSFSKAKHKEPFLPTTTHSYLSQESYSHLPHLHFTDCRRKKETELTFKEAYYRWNMVHMCQPRFLLSYIN